MRRILVIVGALSLAVAGMGHTIPLADLIGPGNLVRDPVYGVSVMCPAGWKVRGATRWGVDDAETTILFRPIWPLEVQPSLYYQAYREKPTAGHIEAHFRRTAALKAQQRINSGLRDYRNLEESFEFSTINGRPAFRYVASYSVEGRKYAEYYTRVAGETMIAMFFVQARETDLAAVRREFELVIKTVRVP
jgi:hypothetical protein